MESGNETKFANKIVIDPRESRTQINNNNDDNSDVAKSQNKNMNEVPHCWKIVREETKVEIKIVQILRIVKVLNKKDEENWNHVVDLKKTKIQNVMMNMLIIVIFLILLHLL